MIPTAKPTLKGTAGGLRRSTAGRVLVVSSCLFFLSLSTPALGQSPMTEHTLKLEPDGDRASAHIEDLAWLAGYWRGEGLGGIIEELWTAPLAGRMIGAFRLIKDDRTVFSEALQLEKQGESLVMRVKHFTPEFVGWEEKEGSVDFPLVKVEGKTAYFNGLTLQLLDDDTLQVYLVFRSKDGSRREEAIRLSRFRVQP